MKLRGLIVLLLLEACARKPRSDQRAWQSNHDQAPAPVRSAPVIPLEPPVELSRVPNSGLPCALEDVLAAKCRRCHTRPTRHGAPFPLLTWEDTQIVLRDRPRFEFMKSAVKSGFMPYNVQANPPVERLTDAEKQTIVDWVVAGAPRVQCGPATAASSAATKRPSAPRPRTH